MKKTFLYLMVLFYLIAGIAHLVKPAFFLLIMPFWLPLKLILIYSSGIVEILLALLLLLPQTRRIASQLIVMMLIVYLIFIHVPQSIDFYKTGNKYFVASLLRIPLQFLLMGWAWTYSGIRFYATSDK
jgi:uncharacterized membrane protein